MPAQSRLVWMNVPPHPYPLYLTLFTNFSHIFCSIYECVNILFRHVGTWPFIWYQEKRDWSFKLGAKRVLNSYLLSKNLLIDYTCRSKNVYCTAIDPHSTTYKSCHVTQLGVPRDQTSKALFIYFWKGRTILKSNTYV